MTPQRCDGARMTRFILPIMTKSGENLNMMSNAYLKCCVWKVSKPASLGLPF